MLTNVRSGGIRRGERETNRETLIHPGWHHMQLSGVVDSAEELLIQLVGAFRAEAYQTQLKTVLINTIKLGNFTNGVF